MTPFASPVVPLENNMTAMASGSYGGSVNFFVDFFTKSESNNVFGSGELEEFKIIRCRMKKYFFWASLAFA